MDDQLQQPNDFQNPSDELPQARRRLGRGLSSLIGGVDASGLADQVPVVTTGDGQFSMVEEHLIARNPWQPRQEFESEALAELVDSVRQHGVLQPLLVRRSEGGFQLVAGERRLMAARKAGLPAVPCRIVELDDKGMCEVAIVENVQRADLNELEKALAFQAYLSQFGGTIEDLAQKLGKDRSTVSNCLRLLELPEFVKVALLQGKISAGHARALLPLEQEADQIAMCQRIQSEHLSVRNAEEQIRLQQMLPEDATIPFDGATDSRLLAAPAISNHILDLQRQLHDLLGAKVEIRTRGRDSGKLIIHFSSNDEFERIVGFLRKAS